MITLLESLSGPITLPHLAVFGAILFAALVAALLGDLK